MIAKDAFRKRLGIFLFENESGNSESEWLAMAVPTSVAIDMSQDMFVSPQPPSEFAEGARRAGFDDGTEVPRSLKRRLAEERNLSHFLSGSVRASDSVYAVSTELYETERGRVIAERTFEYENLFDLVDAVSIQVRRDIGLSDGHIENTPDAPVADLLTSSEEALKAFSQALTARTFRLDHETAVAQFESAVATDPTFAWAHIMLGMAYQDVGRSQQVRDALRTALDHDYRLPERWRFLLNTLYAVFDRRMDQAIETGERWSILFPDDVESFEILAQLYTVTDRLEDAISAHRAVLKLDPGAHDRLLQIALIHRDRGEFEEALEALRSYQEHRPSDAAGFIEEGRILRDQGRLEDAIAALDQALMVDPNDFNSRLTKAAALVRLGAFDPALAQYESLLVEANSSADRGRTLRQIERLYGVRGQWAEAVKYMERGLDAFAEELPPLQVLANRSEGAYKYVRAGQPERAISVLDSAAEQMPIDVGNLFSANLAIGYLFVHLEMNDAEAARASIALSDSIRVATGFDLIGRAVVFGWGRLAELEGRYEDAITHYEQFLESEPAEAETRGRLGRCQLEAGRFADARKSLEHANALDRSNADVLVDLARFHRTKGDPNLARDYLEQAVDIWKDADPGYEPAENARALLKELE
jgi:tetratricopeptide (TPR) repeat protein